MGERLEIINRKTKLKKSLLISVKSNVVRERLMSQKCKVGSRDRDSSNSR